MADSSNINDQPASNAGESAESQYSSQISSMSSFMNKMQTKTDGQIRSMDKRIDNIMKYQLEAKKSQDNLMKSAGTQLVANKELASNTSKILSGLNTTIKHLSVGTQKITRVTADSSKDLLVQYSKAISQDINYNKQNMVGMALAQSSPIFGYFASKFMETDVFQDAAARIKSKMGDAISESLLAAKGLGRTIGDKIGDAFTRKEKLQLSKESKRYMGNARIAGADVAEQIKGLKDSGKIKKAASGGYVQKDGYVNVHAGEVITPMNTMQNMNEALRENLVLMRKMVRSPDDTAKSIGATYAQQTREWQEKLLKATIDMRLAMVGMTSQIRLAWQRMLTEHPFFRSMRSTFDVMSTVFISPFKILFGMRGGYARFLPKGRNAFQNMNSVLGLIFTMFLPKLDKMTYYLGDMHEQMVKSKSEFEDQDQQWSIFGKISNFLKGKKDEKTIKETVFDYMVETFDLDKDALQDAGGMLGRLRRKKPTEKIPSFQEGGILGRTGKYFGHKGEMVLPYHKLSSLVEALSTATQNLRQTSQDLGGRAMGAAGAKYQKGKDALSESMAPYIMRIFGNIEQKMAARTEQHFKRIAKMENKFAKRSERRQEKFEKKLSNRRIKWNNIFRRQQEKATERTDRTNRISLKIREKFQERLRTQDERMEKIKIAKEEKTQSRISKIQEAGAARIEKIKVRLFNKGLDQQERIMAHANKKALRYQDRQLKKIHKTQDKIHGKHKRILAGIFKRQKKMENKQLRYQKRIAKKQAKLEAKRNKQLDKLNALKKKAEQRRQKFEAAIEAKKMKWKNRQEAKAAKLEAKVKMMEMKKTMKQEALKAKVQFIKDKKLFKLKEKKAKQDMKIQMVQMKKDAKRMKAEAKIEAKKLKAEIRQFRKEQWQERVKMFKTRVKYMIDTPKRMKEWKDQMKESSQKRIETAKARIGVLREQLFKFSSISKVMNKHLPNITKGINALYQGMKRMGRTIVRGVVGGVKKLGSGVWKIMMMMGGLLKTALAPIFSMVTSGISAAMGGLAGILPSLGAAGLLPTLGGAAGVGVGGFMMYKDAKKGYANAEKWKTGKTAAVIGGALGGNKGGVAGAKRGALKGGALGAGIGTLIAPGIGTAIGGAIGVVAGGLMGALGGENIAKGLQYVWDKLKPLVKGVWNIITFPYKMMYKAAIKAKDYFVDKFKNIKELWQKGEYLQMSKSLMGMAVKIMTWPVQLVRFAGKEVMTMIDNKFNVSDKIKNVVANVKQEWDIFASWVGHITTAIPRAIKDASVSAISKVPLIGRFFKKDKDKAEQKLKSSHSAIKRGGAQLMSSHKPGMGITGKTLDGLEPNFKARVLAAGKEYSAITGKPMKINSAYRSPEKQAELRKAFEQGRGNPAAKWSIHSSGYAVDIPSAQTRVMRQKGIDQKYGLSFPIGREPWHVEDSTIQGNRRRQLKSQVRDGSIKRYANEIGDPQSDVVSEIMQDIIFGGKDIAKRGASMNSLQTRMLIQENQKAHKLSMDNLAKSNLENSQAVVTNVNNIMSSNMQSVNNNNQGGNGGPANTAFDPLARQILQGDIS